jgi:hypothetical protein
LVNCGYGEEGYFFYCHQGDPYFEGLKMDIIRKSVNEMGSLSPDWFMELFPSESDKLIEEYCKLNDCY